MASISDDGDGFKRIIFKNPAGKRKAIRLGKATMKQAEAICTKVESILSAAACNQSPNDETATWIGGLSDPMHAKLARAGLVKPRGSTHVTLAAFLDAYILDRTDAKPRTIINLKQSRKDLVEFFGDSRPLREITAGDADEFWRWLLRDKGERKGLAQNTARRIIGRSKQFFRVAIRKGFITSNPFTSIKSKVTGSAPEREFFVTREMATKIDDACPNAEWRLIFALSRYGGLRCPSEHLALKWGDVDWGQGRMTVHSPKTEHHEGKDRRVIPLFPEIEKPLLELLTDTKGAGEYIITTYRDGNANLRTQLERIIRRAGLEPWPKLFHNLRSTRETELAETYPIHVVCEWIGNSEVVAKKHYLQMTDEHFASAVKKPEEKSGAKSGAAHGETVGMERKQTPDTNENPPVFPGDYVACDALHGKGIPLRGVEPLSSG